MMKCDTREICLQIHLHPLQHCLSALAFHYVRKFFGGFFYLFVFLLVFFFFVVYAVMKTALRFEGT